MMNSETYGSFPRVTVVIPMRNEESYIGRCLESVLGQDYPEELIEVLVVDGGSTDGSLGVVKEISAAHSNVKVLGGSGVNCPAAMNMGIRDATGELIAKIDAHGYIAVDYVKTSGELLLKDEALKCVGGPINPVGEGRIGEASALARSSLFGVGRGVYSMGESTKWVDTVQCGVYKKGVFSEVGLFDESLQFGEDEEINWRIREKGYGILASPRVRFYYFPRSSVRKLYRQYYNYGVARVRVIRKHPRFLRIKHVVPPIFVLALCLSGVLALFCSLAMTAFIAVVLSYISICLTVSVAISAKEGWKHILFLPTCFAALHFGYGIGFLRGVMQLCLERRQNGSDKRKSRDLG
ncbi:MAG: glycosyltransferase family 2 protein [Thermodesulfobacteriota bacterium]|nr:glycosyltransferase family 2 protein [Thermodesulfobacteriota bacterium]